MRFLPVAHLGVVVHCFSGNLGSLPCAGKEALVDIVHTPMIEEEIEELHRKFEKGAKEGVALALEEHYRMGRQIVVWRDGEVVWLKPEEYKDMTASGLGMTDLLRECGIGPLPSAGSV